MVRDIDRKAERYDEVKAPITDTGIAIAGMSVARKPRRNTKITITTSPSATTSVCHTSLMAFFDERGIATATHMSHTVGQSGP